MQQRVLSYQKKLAQAYNRLIRSRSFQVGELVLKAADHIMKGLHVVKFTPNWEGPYQIADVKPSGYCVLQEIDTGKLSPPTNLKFIKKYYT